MTVLRVQESKEALDTDKEEVSTKRYVRGPSVEDK